MTLPYEVRVKILLSFLTRIIGSAAFPFMGIYFAKEFGLINSSVILFSTIFLSIVTGFLGGYLADNYGRKKILIICYVIQFISALCISFSISNLYESIIITLFCFVVYTLTGSSMTPAMDAILLDNIKKDDRRMMYSLNYWSQNISIALGTMLGAVLFSNYKVLIFILVSLVSLLCLLIMLKIKESYVAKNEEVHSEKRIIIVINTYKKLVSNKRFIFLCLSSLGILSLEHQINNYIAIRLSKEFVTEKIYLFSHIVNIDYFTIFGWIRILNTVLIIFFSFKLSVYFKKTKDSHLFILGGIFYVIGFSLLGSANTFFLITLSVLLFTIGELMFFPIWQNIIANSTEKNNRSVYMAFVGSIFQVAKLLGTLGISIGVILSPLEMSYLYLFMGIISVVSVSFINSNKYSITENKFT